jgi:hypothetical protein
MLATQKVHFRPFYEFDLETHYTSTSANLGKRR